MPKFKKELLTMSKEECSERLQGASAFIRNCAIIESVKVPEATSEENKQFFNEFCLHMQLALAIAKELAMLVDNKLYSEAVENAIENSEEWTEPFSVEKGQ